MTLYNLVKCTTATAGTGDVTPGAAVVPYKDFSDVDNGEVTYVLIDAAESEIGHGTWNGSVVTRDVVLDSTDGGAKINLSGSAIIALTASAEDIHLHPSFHVYMNENFS